MGAKAVILFCAQALMFQSIVGQCSRCGSCSAGHLDTAILAPESFSASHGAGLPVTSTSAVAPSGVSVYSENSYTGELAFCGAVPYLGTVGLEGYLPTSGASKVCYGCGNGQIGMLSESAGHSSPCGCASNY